MKFLGKLSNLKASDEEVRHRFRIPSDRYYILMVWPPSIAGNVFLDESRTRPRPCAKISKSDYAGAFPCE